MGLGPAASSLVPSGFGLSSPSMRLLTSATRAVFPRRLHFIMRAKSTKPKTKPKTKTKGPKKGGPPRSTPIAHPNAAGIDIGAREICVCVPADRDAQSVRTFETFTDSLRELARWLVVCKVDTVAMESTGNYWIPLHQVLCEHGIAVALVNARHVRHVPGRKSDVIDCQWLQYLHSVGLLNGSFRPAQEICAVRSLVRYREGLLAQAADQIRAMHNAFDQMNVQLHHVLSDLSGATGMAIVRAILAGERNPAVLASYRDRRIKATRQTLERSLQGDWRTEHVLVLELAFANWEQLQAQITRLDGEIAKLVSLLRSEVAEPSLPLSRPAKRRSVSANQPSWDMRTEFHRVFGTDLTAIPGISSLTVQTLLSEVGPDFRRFRTVHNFVSWLGLCPDAKISGGKVMDARSRRGKPRLARALRQASVCFHSEKSALGARYRRLRSNLGAPKALTAMAHLLARIIYALVTNRKAYDETVFASLEEHHLQRQLARLAKNAKSMGYSLKPLASETSISVN
jgi:transposase